MRGPGKWLNALVVTGLLCLQATLAHAAPQVGWWWNANESGRGYFIEMKGTILFMAGYFYEEDGRATWAVSGGPITDLRNYTGRLVKVRGGQTLTGPYVMPAPSDVVDIGEISLHFTDDTHGALTWPGGTVAIERQIYGAGDASFQPSGWWWNENESGRGFSIEIQGDTMDVVGFMYDGSGNPVWYISTGKMTSPTHYEGALEQYANGQSMGGPYKPPTLPSSKIGTITIDFASLENGTITLSDAVPTSGALSSRKALVTIPITPQLANPPLTGLPAQWGGTYSGTLSIDPPGEHVVNVAVTGNVTWADAAGRPNLPTFPATATPSRAYVISGGTATLHTTGTVTLTLPSGLAFCSIVGDESVNLVPTFADSYLLFEANGTVTGRIATASEYTVGLLASCPTPAGTVTLNVAVQPIIVVPVNGRHRYDHSAGTIAPHVVSPFTSLGATWDFTGMP